MTSQYERNPEFIANSKSSPNMIVSRVCESCHVPEYKEFYYKRLTAPLSKALLGRMIKGPMDSRTHHMCYSDYTLHSSYEDATNDANPWSYCANAQFVSRISTDFLLQN